MIKNTLVSITDKGVKFMLLIILLAMTSCGTETVFYWNMRDVIGLSIRFCCCCLFVLIIVEWFTNKLKLWKRKETKQYKPNKLNIMCKIKIIVAVTENIGNR
jgi:hypothetical protein